MRIDAGSAAEPEARAAAREVVDLFLARDDERLRQWQERAEHEPPEWYAAALISDSKLAVTAEELAELNRAVLALMEPYKQRNRPEPPSGSRPVSIQYRAVPID
jgi:hypothetical protein